MLKYDVLLHVLRNFFYFYYTGLFQKRKSRDYNLLLAILHICGYNYTEIAPDCEDDYLFAPFGSGAWATWKRVVDEWEGDYAFLSEEVKIEWLKKRYGKLAEISFKNAQRHKETGKEFWESIVGCNCMFNSHYAIIPKQNLVSNMGLTTNSTHSNTSKKYLPKATANLFEMKTYASIPQSMKAFASSI